jgi:hypothetical protein
VLACCAVAEVVLVLVCPTKCHTVMVWAVSAETFTLGAAARQ